LEYLLFNPHDLLCCLLGVVGERYDGTIFLPTTVLFHLVTLGNFIDSFDDDPGMDMGLKYIKIQ